MLCISGQVATAAIGTDAFQECDAIGISRPVTKWNTQITRGGSRRAIRSPRAGPDRGKGVPGRCWWIFPRMCSRRCRPIRTTPCRPTSATGGAALRARRQAVKAAFRLPHSAVRRAADLIAQARRPVFYGGGGLINAGPEACAAFSDLVREWARPAR